MKLNKLNLGAHLDKFITLVLKPLTQDILEKIPEDVTMYHLIDFSSDEILPVETARKDGSTYTTHKCYGVANLSTNAEIDDAGQVSFTNYTTRKVLVMQSSDNVVDGIYVSLSDVIALNRKAKKKLVLDTADDSTDDE